MTGYPLVPPYRRLGVGSMSSFTDQRYNRKLETTPTAARSPLRGAQGMEEIRKICKNLLCSIEKYCKIMN